MGTPPSNISDDVCCETSSDCVYEEVCYSNGDGFNKEVDIDDDDKYGEFCLNTDWIDCDYWPLNCIVTNKCGGSANNVYWAPGGEYSSFGEYDYGYETECCGDDAGEYWISNGGTARCCDNPDDTIDAGGHCV